MKVQALIALKADYRLPVLLQAAGLARSTFFYHQARLESPDPKETLKSAITEVFTANHGRYGHRRIHTELMKKGWVVAKKTVLKLMRALHLRCKVRRRKRYNSYQGEQGVIAPNLLNRKFDADAPNQKWVTDVTEFRVGDHKLYLSPVMENFFGHLKEELFHHVRFLSTEALAPALHEYITWYNNERISTKLKGLSPVQYRAQSLAA